jgi:hypothetical protein
MKTPEEILAKFDNPDTIAIPDSTVSSVRGRLPLEVLLDIRNLSAGIPAIYNGTTPVHIIAFNNEKAIGYADATGVLSIVSDLTKLVISL